MTIPPEPKNCCCCSFTLPAFANNTSVPNVGGTGGCNPAVNVTPEPRGDTNTTECGGNGATDCLGPWPPRDVNTFAANGSATIDDCQFGIKGVVGKKFWTGRYGFTDNYITNPKIDLHFTEYDVAIAVDFELDMRLNCYSSDGTTTFDHTTKSNSGSAQSKRSLTAGGVEDCSGTATAGDGSTSSDNSNGLAIACFAQTGICATFDGNTVPNIAVLLVPDSCNGQDPATDRATNIARLKSWCAITGDNGAGAAGGLGNVTIPFVSAPSGAPTSFTGRAVDFPAFISGWSSTEHDTVCQADSGGWTIIDAAIDFIYSVEDFVVTNTEISGKIVLTTNYSRKYYAATHDPDTGICTKVRLFFEKISTGKMTYTFSAKLSAPYTFGQAALAAQGLLGAWDLTNKKVYPWSRNCGALPMVSLWELDGSPGAGYCDTPAAPALTAIYDGSVKGAPMATVGIYNKGWFDFSLQAYHYYTEDFGILLCYGYGYYLTDYNHDVTMATQLVDGIADTADVPGAESFSRYKINWTEPAVPPYVYNNGGFIADGGDAIYAGKWAEKKVPLPAENFFGPCGAQRLQTLKNTSTCADTGTPRFPNAVGICGKLSVVSAVQSGSSVIIGATGKAWLKNGDLVDFTGVGGLGGSVVVSGLSSSVAAVSSFNVTGTLSGSYTGGGFVSGGAQAGVTRPDPKWYDLAPKGDFVRVTNFNGVVTVTYENVVPTSKSNGIIVIAPPGSPELTGWPGATTAKFSDYPSILPTEYWISAIQQGMGDLYWTHSQDELQSDGMGGCQSSGATNPVVCEARVTAPNGAPWDFSTCNGNDCHKLLGAGDFGTVCSGVWNLTSIFSTLPYDNWPGVNTSSVNATADQYNIGHDADALDAGLGTA